MLWQSCTYALVGFRHKKHQVRFRKTSSFSLKYLFLSPKHSCKLSHGLFNNIGWFQSYKCWNAVSYCSLWLTGFLAPCLRIWKVINMYCIHVNRIHKLWIAKVSVVAEMLTTNTLSWRLGWPVPTFLPIDPTTFLQVPPTVRSAFSPARLISLNAT